MPNSVSLSLRLFCAAVLGALLLYVVVALLTGYTYFPGKRGGFFFSGIPSLMLVVAAICTCVAATLTIVDHYDRRANEATYRAAREKALRAGLAMFVAAPLVQLVDALLLAVGADVFPRFHGLADQYTLHSPELRTWLPLMAPVVEVTFMLALIAFPLGSVGALLLCRSEERFRRPALALMSLALLVGGLCIVTMSMETFLKGEVKAGRRHNRVMITAAAEPAKFNAVLLSHVSLGGLLFVGGVTGLVALIRTRRPQASGGRHAGSGRS